MNSDYSLEDIEMFLHNLMDVLESGEKAGKIVRQAKSMTTNELIAVVQARVDLEGNN